LLETYVAANKACG